MKAFSAFTQIHLHRQPVDMRCGINGLSSLVELAQMGTFTEAHLFVFVGKRRDSIKILYFARSGFCLWQKRLDEARFPWPKNYDADVITITSEQMQWLIDGYDVWKMKPFKEVKFERTI